MLKSYCLLIPQQGHIGKNFGNTFKSWCYLIRSFPFNMSFLDNISLTSEYTPNMTLTFLILDFWVCQGNFSAIKLSENIILSISKFHLYFIFIIFHMIF